jgi:hypothetical protein
MYFPEEPVRSKNIKRKKIDVEWKPIEYSTAINLISNQGLVSKSEINWVRNKPYTDAIYEINIKNMSIRMRLKGRNYEYSL